MGAPRARQALKAREEELRRAQQHAKAVVAEVRRPKAARSSQFCAYPGGVPVSLLERRCEGGVGVEGGLGFWMQYFRALDGTRMVKAAAEAAVGLSTLFAAQVTEAHMSELARAAHKADALAASDAAHASEVAAQQRHSPPSPSLQLGCMHTHTVHIPAVSRSVRAINARTASTKTHLRRRRPRAPALPGSLSIAVGLRQRAAPAACGGSSGARRQ